MAEAALTPNTIERIAILDYRIERLQDLIATGRRQGLATHDLEQALGMCEVNRAALGADDLMPVGLLAAVPGSEREEAPPRAAREA